MVQHIGRFLLAVVAGYATMVLLISLVQEGIFGGVTYQETPFPQLLIAGLLTTASAVAGGAVAAGVFGKPYYPPSLAIGGLVVLETTYMILAGQLPGPVWFDMLAGGSLLTGILVGTFAIQRLRPGASPSASVT